MNEITELVKKYHNKKMNPSSKPATEDIKEI